MLAFVWNYARTVFSPGHPEWRPVQLDSKSAGTMRTLFCAIFGLFVVDRVLAAGFELAGAGIGLTLAQATLGNSLFAVLLWLSLSPRHWHSSEEPASDTPVKDSTKEGPNED